jgi:hypothetical protein
MPQQPHGEDRPAKTISVSAQSPHLGFVQHMLEAQKRERDHLLREVLKARGLMPLLMKQRNGSRWTAEERRELMDRLNALSQISPYLVAMAVPGSMLMLPVLAWWLDRRRGKRG